MQESGVSVSRSFFLPLWARIAFACFTFAVAALLIWDEFSRFNWVFFLCVGLFYLIHVPRQKGESPKAYFSRPRSIISNALNLGTIVGGLHNMYYVLFVKHHFF